MAHVKHSVDGRVKGRHPRLQSLAAEVLRIARKQIAQNGRRSSGCAGVTGRKPRMRGKRENWNDGRIGHRRTLFQIGELRIPASNGSVVLSQCCERVTSGRPRWIGVQMVLE